MLQLIYFIDRYIIDFINNNLQSDFLNRIMAFFSIIGDDGFLWMVLICFLLMSKKYRKIGCLVACAFLLSRITVDILKPLIKRPRPFIELEYLEIYIPKPTGYSFPSGHSITSFATIGVLVNKIQNNYCKILLIILACLVSCSRVYLLVHYPSDILAGIILGLICSRIALYYCDDFKGLTQ